VRLAITSWDEFVDGDGFIAAGAEATGADGAHPGVAVLAALFAEGAGAAGVAFVDGDGAAATGRWERRLRDGG
jgi:hypothetical protein